jgi:aspartokinase-like uncharacterized kinase
MSGGLTVVKLGGSHAASPRLREIVAAIAGAQRASVIVPGGGPFADTVRVAQEQIGFDDGAAHRMALLAMCQFGEALASLHRRLKPASGIARLRKTLAQDAVPVWMPWPMTDGLEALPASWDITSDSLAAWLGARLGAARLLLLKSAEPPLPRPVSAADLTKTGIADPAFAHYLEESGLAAWWLGPSALPRLSLMIDGQGECGVPIRTGTA